MKFKDIEEKTNVNELSEKLSIAKSTVKKWEIENRIPDNYRFDIFRIIGKDIDYTEYTPKEKDQIYTKEKTVKKCLEIVKSVLRKYKIDESVYTYVEPSAGNGSFLKLLPENRVIAFDIEPKFKGIIEKNYLEWKPKDVGKKFIVIGNPPFGLRGNLALRFINNSDYADFVCFILPQMFESDGKGVPRKRVKDFNLVYSEKIDSDFVYSDGIPVNVECVFQVWSKYFVEDKYQLLDTSVIEKIIKIYSLSNGGTPSSTRNKKMINKCDLYLPSTVFGLECVKVYESFDDLPDKRGYGLVFVKNKEEYIEKCRSVSWDKVCFKSTNSSYNLRKSLILQQFL